MSIAIKLALALVVALASYFGTNALTEHYRAQGRAEVQAKWDAANLKQERDHAKAVAESEIQERAKERAAQVASEENARAAAQREAVLRSRAADLDRSVDGLRRELAATDRAFAAYRAARPDAAALSESDAAAAGARELLGQCAGRYAGMAESAAGLADQVIGLQAHVLVIQPEAARLMEPLE